MNENTSKSPLNWSETYDENDNTCYEATSFWEEGFEYKIRPILRDNSIRYELYGDPEVCDALKEKDDDYLSVAAAKAACEEAEREQIEEAKREQSKGG